MGFHSEYSQELRAFSDDELSMDLICSMSMFSSDLKNKAMFNLHQITLKRIVDTLEILRKVAETKNQAPLYQDK
jgi:inorganic triphosphatase YgiF